MRLRRFLLAFLISLAAFQFCFSQEKNGNLTLLASIGEITYEELAAITDSLASEVYKTPNSVGYIVFYGGSNKIENAFFKRAIVRNLRFRNFDKKKLFVVSSVSLEKPKFEFWLSKDGTKPAIKEEADNFILPTANEAIYFAGDLIETTEIEQKQTYYFVGCEAGCIQYPDLYLLSEFLKANSQLKAFLVIHNKKLKKAKFVKKILAKEILENTEIQSNRLVFLYGGKNKANVNQFSEIEVYLALNQSQIPKLSLIKYKSL